MSDVPNLELETEPVEPVAIEPAQPIVEPVVVKPEETVDFWKKKFSDSSSEANLLREAEAKRVRDQQELTKEPTESELRTAFPEWDTLTDFEKRMARENLETKRLTEIAVKTTQQLQNDRSWATSVELAITSDPALQGKEQEFRQFASRPQYRGAPMDLIKDSFLQRNGAAPVTTPITTPKPGLETGNGGPRTPEKPKTISTEELTALRTSNPRAYEQYIKTHDLEIDL